MIVKKNYSKIVILALAVLLFFVAFASLFFGQIEIPIKNTVSIIGYQLGLPFFDKSDFWPAENSKNQQKFKKLICKRKQVLNGK